MGLIHHVVPFSARQFTVIPQGQQGIAEEELFHPVGQVIGGRALLGSVQPVPAGGNVQIVQIGTCLYGEKHQLKKSVTEFCRQLITHRRGIVREPVPGVGNKFRLPVMMKAESGSVDQFRLPATVVPRIIIDHTPDFRSILRTEYSACPFPGIAGYPVGCHHLGIPGHVQEKMNGKFHGFDIAHINDPDTVHPIPVTKVHLFPNPGNGVCIQPLIIPGTAHIIEMVIHAVAARSGR